MLHYILHTRNFVPVHNSEARVIALILIVMVLVASLASKAKRWHTHVRGDRRVRCIGAESAGRINGASH